MDNESFRHIGETIGDFFQLTKEMEAEAQEMLARFSNQDGTMKPGFLKAPNGKTTHLSIEQWLLVRTPSFQRWFGDWESAFKYKMILHMNPVVLRPLPQNADIREIYVNLENGKNELDGSVVRFVHSTLGKILRHKGYDSRWIIPQIKEIFDKSIPLGFQKERLQAAQNDGTVHKAHPNFVGYHNYLGKIKGEDGEHFVRFTVQEEKTRKKDYIAKQLHSTFISAVSKYKTAGIPLSQSTTSVGEREDNSGIDIILMQYLLLFKSNYEIIAKNLDENGEPVL